MFRVSLLSLENNLGRNRGTGGANEYLVQARSNIYADYFVPLFTSYTTLLTRTTTDLDKYLKRLKLDKEVPMENKKAVVRLLAYNSFCVSGKNYLQNILSKRSSRPALKQRTRPPTAPTAACRIW